MQLLEIAGELVGVSKQAMSGLPAPGISATGTIASQQAVQARIGNDANHYTPQLISLLKAAMDVIVQSWEAEEVIYMPDGTAIPVNRDELQGFHGGILVNSVGASSVAVYQQQQIMQMHALLSQSPFYNQLEGVKLVVDSFQLPEIRTRNLLQMPPPMPMPGQPTGPQGIAGQPPRKQGPGQPKPEMPPMGGEAPPKIPGQASRRLAERGQNPFTVRGTSPEGPPR
jgi:hypothetical protein